jgi:phage major head subunit gpT-like protein
MISPSGITAFVTNCNTMWGQTYSTTPIIYPQFVTTVPVTSSQLVLAWTGMMPKFRVWYGPRVVNEDAPQTYTVVPRPYENTYAIDRFTLDDDQFGVHYRLLPDMARQAKRWPEYEIRDLLENAGAYTGAAQNGFDGLTYFNTAHPVDLYDTTKGTYINDFTGGGQNVTITKPTGSTTVLTGGAISPTAFLTLWGYMSTLKGEDNEALNVTPNRLMHAPLIKGEVQLLLKSTFFAPPAWSSIGSQVGAADNPLTRFGVEPIENPLFKNALTWYLMDCTKATMPFTWALREAIMTVPRVNENDPVVFDSHRFLWGGWGRAAPAWGFSWLAARSGP